MTDLFCTLPQAYSYRYPACGGGAAPVTVANATALINVASQADVDAARLALIDYIWGTTTLPTTVPAESLGITEARLSWAPNVASVDLLTFTLPFSTTQYAWRLHASAGANGRTFIYHGGHAQELDNAYTQLPVTEALRAGYDVILICMPFVGSNSAATYGGQITTHEGCSAIEADHGSLGYSALTLFVEPVIQTLNMLAADGITHISMCGLSGGGWTTTLAAALDERIRFSYPVSGTQPWYCRTTANDQGDWEQQEAGYLDEANYEDQYVMGTSAGRRQVQFCGWYDTVFLASNLAGYEADITARAAALGGSWKAYGDRTYVDHEVSPATMATILGDMR